MLLPSYSKGTPKVDEAVYNGIRRRWEEKEAKEDKNGNVVCEYIDRNETVVSLRSTPKDRTLLPITVCTEDDLRAAQQTAAVRHVIFCAAYCLECLVIAAVYIRKKAK